MPYSQMVVQALLVGPGFVFTAVFHRSNPRWAATAFAVASIAAVLLGYTDWLYVVGR